MLQTTEVDGVLHIVAGGKLKASDYDRFKPFFERIAAQEGAVPMLIELAPDFSGWDVGGLWQDLKFDVKHKDWFGRIAILGDKKWEEWGTKLSDPIFASAEMHFFAPEERNDAENWVHGGQVA